MTYLHKGSCEMTGNAHLPKTHDKLALCSDVAMFFKT